MSRRTFLGALGLVTASTVGGVLTPGLARAASVCAAPGATLDDIEHVVILMQENRSFDEYFGRMSGVIGFDDPQALPGVFKQAGGTSTDGYVLPWRMDTTTTDAQSSGGLLHDWPNQHAMWANGLMDDFLAPQLNEAVVMGYYNQEDIPYHYALADNWTVCDRYHCSVFGPTTPNRVLFMSGTIDPTGTLGGGPIIENTPTNGQLMWEAFPETLQKAGVDWFLYQEADNYGDNMLPFFAAFQDTASDLFRRGCGVIPSTALLGEATAEKIKQDVLAGTLPQVSWIVGAQETSEHPNASSGRGAQFIDQILMALTADMAVWAKTLFIINYDENDGHFDHVVPPTPPVGTLDEEVAGLPVGLGFRVPLILVSPFTRGPLVSSDVFDHTSVIQFLERRFGVTCPNISPWRRAAVGDLTSAINFAATPSPAVPSLPDANRLAAEAKAQSSLPAPAPPTVQVMPKQYAMPLRGRPSGLPKTTATSTGTGTTTVTPQAACAAADGSPAAAALSTVQGLKGATPAEGNARTRAALAAKQSKGTLAATGMGDGTVVAGAVLAAAGLAALRLRSSAPVEQV